MSTANAAIETVAGTALDELSNRSLTFLIGDVVYGIELSHVIEIISIQPITPVPAGDRRSPEIQPGGARV